MSLSPRVFIYFFRGLLSKNEKKEKKKRTIRHVFPIVLCIFIRCISNLIKEWVTCQTTKSIHWRARAPAGEHRRGGPAPHGSDAATSVKEEEELHTLPNALTVSSLVLFALFELIQMPNNTITAALFLNPSTKDNQFVHCMYHITSKIKWLIFV